MTSYTPEKLTDREKRNFPRINLYVSRQLESRILRDAEEQGRSVSGMIRRILQDHYRVKYSKAKASK